MGVPSWHSHLECHYETDFSIFRIFAICFHYASRRAYKIYGY